MKHPTLVAGFGRTGMAGSTIRADATIVGAGAAGLSLLAHLADAGWGGTVALVDDAEASSHRRAWAWWTRGDLLIDAHATAHFTRATLAGEGWSRTVELAPYTYRAITSDALRLAATPPGAAVDVVDVTGVAVSVERGRGRGTWRCVVDGDRRRVVEAASLYDSVGVGARRPRGREVAHLDFEGWRVRADRDAFDPAAFTLMDFRTGQGDGAAFMYVLPASAREALVERTVFAMGRRGKAIAHEHELRRYLADAWPGVGLTIVGVERGAIPLVAPRVRSGAALIGAPAGAVKASTGYAFARIQRHSRALAAAIAEGGPAPRGPRSRWWPALLDRALLTVLREDPDGGREILEALLRRCGPRDLFRFLDEDLPLAGQARLFARLPLGRFVRAYARRFARLATHPRGGAALRG